MDEETQLREQMKAAKKANNFDLYRKLKWKLWELMESACDQCEIAAQTY